MVRVEEKGGNSHRYGLVGPQLEHEPVVLAAEAILVNPAHPRTRTADVVAAILRAVFGDPKVALERPLDETVPICESNAFCPIIGFNDAKSPQSIGRWSAREPA